MGTDNDGKGPKETFFPAGSTFDDLLDVAGRFGRYQKTIVFVFLITTIIPSGLVSLSSVFLAATPGDFWCRTPDLDSLKSETFYEAYRPPKEKKSCQLCVSRNLSASGNVSACNTFDKELDSCQFGVLFNREIFEETIVTEWELVCDRKFQATLTFTFYKAGGIFGPLLFGFLADRIGRKKGFYLCAAFQCIFELSTGFVPSYVWFCICRFCVGMTTHSCYLIPYIVCLEIIGPKHRASVSVCFSLFYTIGMLVYVGIAYGIRQWRYLNLTTVIISITFYIILWYFFPESPRWLLSRHRHDDVEKFLIKVAKRNKRTLSPEFVATLPELLRNIPQESQVHNASRSAIDLFRTSNLRKKTLILVLLNVCNKGVSMGLNLYSPLFSPNPHLSAFLNSVVEIPPYFFAKSVFNQFGRRTPLFFGLSLGGLSFLSAFAIAEIYSEDTQSSPIYYVILSMTLLAKFCITITYMSAKLLEDELFPTVVRGNGHAFVSFLSAILTCGVPFIVDLGHIYEVLPLSVFGSLCLFSSFTVFFLPETVHQPLPQTLQDGEEFGKTLSWKEKFRLVPVRPMKTSNHEMDPLRSLPIEDPNPDGINMP